MIFFFKYWFTGSITSFLVLPHEFLTTSLNFSILSFQFISNVCQALTNNFLDTSFSCRHQEKYREEEEVEWGERILEFSVFQFWLEPVTLNLTMAFNSYYFFSPTLPSTCRFVCALSGISGTVCCNKKTLFIQYLCQVLC